MKRTPIRKLSTMESFEYARLLGILRRVLWRWRLKVLMRGLALLLVAALVAVGASGIRLQPAAPIWLGVTLTGIVLGAIPVGKRAWAALRQRRGADINLLMIVAVIGAVALSLAGAVGILAINGYLSMRATREGVPRRGRQAMWLITGGTFVLTIGFGFFSPINLVIAMVRAGAAG
ncbi:MAG: hypothetical protein IID49_12470 [Proteobacteria bacterium]|nr:hypothetical protein [Pseudomonadota bacterium]